ncbi:MAG: protein translocase subunit SecF [Acidimicrobiales bacterium]
MSLRDLFAGRASYDFVPMWRKTLPASAVAAVISLLLLVVVGLNLSIDFRGGGIFEVPVADDVDVAEARDALSDPSVRVQIVENAAGQRSARIVTGADSLDGADTLVEELSSLGGVTADDVSFNTVSATWGDQITSKAIRALLFFFAAVSLYLAWQLEWRMAAGALVAVIHDLLITAGVYALFRFEVSPATVIALLTIMGYSLYDTVVVYDRIWENELERNARQQGYTKLVSRSMNHVMMRSINTTITTVLPVASMLLIGWLVLGGTTLQSFAVALFIGLILGTYSSLFVAAPFLAWLKERQDPEIAEEDLKERRAIRARKQAETRRADAER